MKHFDDMSYHEQRDVLFSQVEELKAEIADLKTQVAIMGGGDFEAEVQRKWNLTPQRVHVLLILYRARGRTLSQEFIHQNLPESGFCIAREDTNLQLINVQVCHLRRALGKGAVLNIWGRGYALSPEMIAELDAMRSPEVAA